MGSLAFYGPNLWSTERPSPFHLHHDPVTSAVPSFQLGCHVARPRLPGKGWWDLEARRHPHIPGDADKGPLVINWSLSQQMALLHLLHQDPAAKPAVTLERLLLTPWALGQFSVLHRQTFGFSRSLPFPLSSLTPIKGLAEYGNKEARRVKFINDCGKFGFHGCQQLLCRLRWVEITAQGCYFARWQDKITNDKLNSLLQQGGGISLCEPGAYLTGEAALSGFLLFFLAVLMPANAYSSVSSIISPQRS